MNWMLTLGLLAGALSTFAFVPQVVATWRSKSVNDLSPTTCVIAGTSVTLWLFYGLLTEDLPMIVANAVSVSVWTVQVSMVFRFRGRNGVGL